MKSNKNNNEERKTSEKIECQNCGIVKSCSTANYYENKHPLFSKWNRLIICKNCINDYIGDKNSNGYLHRVYTVLSLLDKPYLPELWRSRSEEWQKYIPTLSSMPQYKGLTFKDSIFEESRKKTEIIQDIPHDYTDDELVELQSLWGRGLSLEDLEYLQNEYGKLINSYECDSYAMELLFQEAAQQRLTIKKLREAEKPVDKELKTLQDLLGSANIKPVQETGANATEQATFGTLIKKYENERPIPAPDPEWEDIDGIKKYVQVWFLGHLCRMLGINNEYSRMYDEEVSQFTVENPTYESDEDEEVGE